MFAPAITGPDAVVVKIGVALCVLKRTLSSSVTVTGGDSESSPLTEMKLWSFVICTFASSQSYSNDDPAAGDGVSVTGLPLSPLRPFNSGWRAQLGAIASLIWMFERLVSPVFVTVMWKCTVLPTVGVDVWPAASAFTIWMAGWTTTTGDTTL